MRRSDLAFADHVAERAGWPALHGRCRHGDRLRQRLDLEPHIDELAWPQLESGVWKFCLQLQRAGGLIDLVVDAPQGAGINHGDAVIAEHVDRELSLRRRGIDPHDLLLRQAELHGDRLQLGDDDEAGGVRRADDVALVDLAQTGPARDRRHDLGVAERCRGIVDRRLVGLDQRLLLRDDGALRIGLLLGAGAAGGELLVTGEIELLVGKLRLVLRLLGDSLIVLGLIDGRIDLGEHIALLDVLPLDEVDGDQLAVDLRSHRHRVQGADRADAVEIDRHVLDDRRGREHRHRKVGPGESVDLLLLLLHGHPADIAKAAEDQQRDRDRHQPPGHAGPRPFHGSCSLLVRFKEHRPTSPCAAPSRRPAPDTG